MTAFAAFCFGACVGALLLLGIQRMQDHIVTRRIWKTIEKHAAREQAVRTRRQQESTKDWQ